MHARFAEYPEASAPFNFRYLNTGHWQPATLTIFHPGRHEREKNIFCGCIFLTVRWKAEPRCCKRLHRNCIELGRRFLASNSIPFPCRTRVTSPDRSLGSFFSAETEPIEAGRRVESGEVARGIANETDTVHTVETRTGIIHILRFDKVTAVRPVQGRVFVRPPRREPTSSPWIAVAIKSVGFRRDLTCLDQVSLDSR